MDVASQLIAALKREAIEPLKKDVRQLKAEVAELRERLDKLSPPHSAE